MDVIDRLKGAISRMGGRASAGQDKASVLRSEKYGDFNLANPSDRKRLKTVVIDLMRESDRLSEHDIAHWRYACRVAADIESPRRSLLYDIYADVELDLHLSGAIGQVNGFVKRRSFKLSDQKGDRDADAMRYFDTEWFKALLDYILDSINWGHSLIQLGDVITDASGNLAYDGVRLVPRKHVIPEYGRVVRSPGDDWKNGLEYRKAPYTDWLIEAGRPDNLGLYRKAALQTIPKKYALAFWDTFAEMFGVPIRIATTSLRDPAERNKLGDMMENMGNNAWGVFGDDTEIRLIESSRGDAYNVYDRRIERANSEMSKLVLQQTMTIDDGSSYAQSATHLKVFDNLIETHCDMVRDIVNNQLLPRMARHGFPVGGLTFDWDDPIDYTPEQQIAFERMILENYQVPGSYFEQKYEVPAGKRRDAGFTLPGGEGSGRQKSQNNTATEDPCFFD